MKHSCITFLIFFASLFVQAQSPDFTWVKHLGGTLKESSTTISLDASGNIYTSGHFEGTVDFDPGVATYTMASPGDLSVFVSKLDPQGNFLWARQISPPVINTNSDAHAWSHALASNGDICVTGYFNGVFDFNPGGPTNILYAASDDVFIVKLDAQGNFVWHKQFGGTYSDMANAIAIDGANNVYTTGFFMDTVDFDPGAPSFTIAGNASGNAESFVSKLDAAGNFVWAKHLATTNGSIGNDITVDALGNVFSTGTFNGISDFDPGAGTQNVTGAGDQDIYVWKLTSAGNLDWVKTMGGLTKEGGTAVITDPAGNVFVSGFFTGTVDFDPSAATNNRISAGNDDSFVLKLDATGNLIWVNAVGGPGTDVTSALALDANGGLYSIGQFSATVDFDSGPATYTLAGSAINTFISKVDGQGNFLWAKQINGGQNAGGSIAVDANTSIYSTGYFRATSDFDPNSAVVNLTALGDEDIYIHKMSCGTPPQLTATSSQPVLCEGASATLVGTGALTFTWNAGSPNPIVVSPTITTNYTLSGSDAIGCKNSVIFTQSVSTCAGLDLSNNLETSLRVYPNPAHDRITLSLENAPDHSVTIQATNALGQLLISQTVSSSETTLSTAQLPAGIYFLSAFQDGLLFGRVKIIKE